MMAAPVALPVSVDSLGSGDALYTLNEPIISTFMRDLRRVGKKLKTVLVPLGAEADTLKELRDWDLWGPLLLCLVLSIITSARAPSGQHSLVFAGVFVLVWVGAAVVTLNAKLLGGKMCVARARAARRLWGAPLATHAPPLLSAPLAPLLQLLLSERLRAGLLRVPAGHSCRAGPLLEQRSVEGAHCDWGLLLVLQGCVGISAGGREQLPRHCAPRTHPSLLSPPHTLLQRPLSL